MIWMDVDTALPEFPVNLLALIDDSDFKSREESVTFDQAGLDLLWNFVTTAGVFSQVAVTPTDTAGDYDWINQGNGMYTIEMPFSGGASMNNDSEGYGWFTGFATGILPWIGPVIGFRAAALNNALIDGGDNLDVNAVSATAPFVQDMFTVDSGEVSGAEVSGSLILEIAKVVCDRVLTGATHNINNSLGKRLRQIEQSFVHANGTIATVTNGHTFTLDSGAVATADYYVGDRLQIIEGVGAGQSRLIAAYTSGRVATLDSNFTVNPNTSSLYEVIAADVHVSLSDADLAGGFVATYTNTTTITLDSGAAATTDYYVGEMIVFTHGAGKGQSREITGYTSGRVVTMSPALVTALDTTTTYHIQTSVSIPEIVDEVWNEATSGHTTSGSTAKALTDVLADTANMQPKLGTPAADVSADIAAVKTATDAIPTTAMRGTDDAALASVCTEVRLATLTDWINDGRLDVILDLINARPTTAMTESYAAKGADSTPDQAVMMILQRLNETSNSGTTATTKKLDGSSTAATLTYDDADNPTSISRTT